MKKIIYIFLGCLLWTSCSGMLDIESHSAVSPGNPNPDSFLASQNRTLHPLCGQFLAVFHMRSHGPQRHWHWFKHCQCARLRSSGPESSSAFAGDVFLSDHCLEGTLSAAAFNG